MCEIFNYELITENVKCNIEKLFFSIICRRWDIVNIQIDQIRLEWDKLRRLEYIEGVNIEKCFAKNLQFLRSNKNKMHYEKLCNKLGNGFKDLVADKNCDYDSKDFYDNKSVLDVFFEGNQPVLDVKKFEKQLLAAKQVMKNNATMVVDEVGTGKTVAGIYAIQQVIQNRIDETPKNQVFSSACILIVCPYSKREDWNSDIRRQLGRNSIIINQSESGKIIKQKSKNPDKPLIYIMGCVGGDTDDKSALKQSFKTFQDNRNWDLLIIDECHNCFNNYKDIIADRVMLLTATPIVVSGNNVRNFQDYKGLMNQVLGSRGYWDLKIPIKKNIDPILISKPTEDDIFVCNYKEDIFNVEINRKIKFLSCDRNEKRQEWFNELRYKKDFFTAMYADQDDTRLSEKMIEHFGESLNDYSIESNAKLEKTLQLVEGREGFEEYSNKSIIIFCEMQATVDMIYEKLSCLSTNKTMIGKKYGKFGEIRNVTSNSSIVLEKLKSHTRSNKENRSILVITGKSGGTGLNLGEFDTVIHYELPYTNNELEQRFGRIERADDLITKSLDCEDTLSIENEMIFLVNESIENQSDFETNRMLYYAVNKVNIACKHMPIRNTVLFHPNFTKRVQLDASKFFEEIKQFCVSEEGKHKIENYINYKMEEAKIIETVRKITESLNENHKDQVNVEKDLNEKIRKILNSIESDDIIEEHKVELSSFLEKDLSNIVALDNILDKTLEYYIWLKGTCKFYGIELTVEEDHTKYEDYDSTNEENFRNELENEYPEEESKSSNEKKLIDTINSLKIKIIYGKLTLNLLCEKVIKSLDNIKNEQKANGVFYVLEDIFMNESVVDFRNRRNAQHE